jgi:hypothetical protein
MNDLRKIILSFGFGGLLAAVMSGCGSVSVQPWERAALTDYSMRANRDPLAIAAAEHTYFSRESANGGRGVGGSGCGCN